MRDNWTWRSDAPAGGGDAAVFDLDGVLSDAAGRQHFLDGSSGPKDWRAFFAALDESNFQGEFVIEREAGTQRVADIRKASEVVEQLSNED